MHELYDGSDLKSETMSQSYPEFTAAEPNPSHPPYRQSEIMFPRMPILTDDLRKTSNAIDEFLSFNNSNSNKPDKADDAVNETSDFKMGDDGYLNMVSMLNDNYPKIDLNGISVEKPVDVVVGLPDHFVIRNYSMADKMEGEKNEILNENRYQSDFILSDNDFLTGSNLLTAKQLTENRNFESGSNLMGDHVLNLDFTSNHMYVNQNFPGFKSGGGKTNENCDYGFGNNSNLCLNYGDGYCFMEDSREKNYGNYETVKAIEGCKENSPELGFEENGTGLTDIDLKKNLAYVKDEGNCEDFDVLPSDSVTVPFLHRQVGAQLPEENKIGDKKTE